MQDPCQAVSNFSSYYAQALLSTLHLTHPLTSRAAPTKLQSSTHLSSAAPSRAHTAFACSDIFYVYSISKSKSILEPKLDQQQHIAFCRDHAHYFLSALLIES
jgi:hypothetical protein